MNPPIRSLRIETLWNGKAVPDAHHIVIEWVEFPQSIELRVDAPYYGAPAPPEEPPGPTDKLWEHEVVEVFVSGSAEQYTEIEMAPSGHHLVLQLDGVRNTVATKLPLEFKAQVQNDRWTGVAIIARELLPASPWRVNATAIHGAGAQRTYLSMAPLPGSAPDFHQPDRFQPLS